jgi:hypothetical protein
MERQGDPELASVKFSGKHITTLVRDSSGIFGSYAEVFGLCPNFYLTIMVHSDKVKDRSSVQALRELCGLG